ncbi:MAG TPA: DNA alkylation repair protein [Candidatus Nanoarchaeia archaeon]|nr:DNA alkylation repair protein [Candidatus Nanoarchaeia archaeon]
MLSEVRQLLRKAVTPGKKKVLQGFFKTGKGHYGAGDVFLGVMVPDTRRIAKQFRDLSLTDIQELLSSKVHEERLLALLILVEQFSADPQRVASFYVKHRSFVNNWDLVDISAPKILGSFLLDKPRDMLYDLAVSPVLWDRRMAIVATYAFIRAGQFEDTLRLAEVLLQDKHDLLQKAVGWMLREVGKKDQRVLEAFLRKHSRVMPRTMLRYAVERLSPEKKALFMAR